ncbi:MAG: peptide-methionine (S)-S-oxide reductase MsrA [archaeon]|nr:peptide-methionine (S)-S-oxide reductase MsrA [archaeon]
MDSENNIEIAIFGGGCFWCTEAVFKMFKGIISVNPGYAGGIKENPTYEEVSNGKTGHAEVIKIEYNPNKISFETLLTIFFATHDPTTKNQQGNDIGEQYRSIILYTNERQKKTAQNFIEELNKSNEMGDSIKTELKHFDKFYEAESYHKDYYEKNKNNSYCEVVINPKLEKAKEKFAELLNSPIA